MTKRRNDKIKSAFSTSEAARAAEVSHQTVDYWARTKLVVPSIADAHGVGTDRRYSFADLLLLRVARELRQAGIPTRTLRKALECLRKEGYPEGDYRLVGIGGKVCTVEKGKVEETVSGQAVFAFMLDLRQNRERVARKVGQMTKAA